MERVLSGHQKQGSDTRFSQQLKTYLFRLDYPPPEFSPLSGVDTDSFRQSDYRFPDINALHQFGAS